MQLDEVQTCFFLYSKPGILKIIFILQKYFPHEWGETLPIL